MLLSGSKYPLGAGGPVAEVTQPNTSNSCQQLSLWRPPHSHCLPGCHPQHQAQDPLLGAPTLTPLFLGVGTAHAKGLPWWLSGKESTCQCRRPVFDPCRVLLRITQSSCGLGCSIPQARKEFRSQDLTHLCFRAAVLVVRSTV